MRLPGSHFGTMDGGQSVETNLMVAAKEGEQRANICWLDREDATSRRCASAHQCVIIRALSPRSSLTLGLVVATRRGRSSEFGREHQARPLGERTHHRKAALHHAHRSEQMAKGSKPP